MSRTLEASYDEVIKEKSLQEEEDTSTETGESEKNETDEEEDTSINDTESKDEVEESEEETVTLLKTEHQKLIEERDNYKQGMLSAKAKKRGTDGLSNKTDKVDVNEDAVVKVLSKREEQKALANTIDAKHPDYIPELVDDNQYQQIIGYMPRNVDKTSYDSIVRGLKLATKMWKEDRGIQDKSPKKNTNVQTIKTSNASQNSNKQEKKERKFLRKHESVLEWYK